MKLIVNARYGYTGILNIGNTCYINSVIQCFSNFIKMTEYYLNYEMIKDHKYKDLFKNYIILIRELWKGNHIVKPTSFKNSINFIFKKYNNNQQHDAYEFMTDLINVLHEYSSKSSVEVYSDYSSNKFKESRKEWRKHFDNQTSFVLEYFYGQFITKYTCNLCYNNFYKYEPFASIDLSVPPKVTSCDLNYIINKNFTKDYLNIECEKCSEDLDFKKNPEHKITNRIYKLPEILIFVIKRYNNHLQKNNFEMTLNETITMEPYYFTNNNESNFYSLKSIICNSGDTLYSGHYYSIIKRGSSFKIYDDSKIYSIDSLDYNSIKKDSYILFYERKH